MAVRPVEEHSPNGRNRSGSANGRSGQSGSVGAVSVLVESLASKEDRMLLDAGIAIRFLGYSFDRERPGAGMAESHTRYIAGREGTRKRPATVSLTRRGASAPR